MGQESAETCTDRSAEVSVIKFVSRNRTIEEITPKKEVYKCTQNGCGKVFTEEERYKTHETLESLKMRFFLCREPGCHIQLSDPGSVWKHYRECHTNETNVFDCPFTRCSSEHATSESLEEHIKNSHRRAPIIPTEPEIICFEGSDNVIMEDVTRISDSVSGYDNERSVIKDTNDNSGIRKNEYSRGDFNAQHSDYNVKEENVILTTNSLQEDYFPDQSKLRAALIQDNNVGTKFPKNKDLLITKESFFIKYEARSPICSNESMQIDSPQETSNTIFISSDVSLTKNANQEHRIELGNLENVFRSGLEGDTIKIEENINESKNNCSNNDEEYTPKKQRMSRSKQDPYKCEINGCGKTYKYISHFRHHQDSHKLITNSMNVAKSTKSKLGKTTTISYFICKMPGCGAQLSSVNTLLKHYQETHANMKPPTTVAKCTEIYRCKGTGCEMEFPTSQLLYKHFNETHSKNSLNNANTNIKTGSGGAVLVEQSFHKDATAQEVNFKTDLKAKHTLNTNEFTNRNNKNIQSSIIKEESGD